MNAKYKLPDKCSATSLVIAGGEIWMGTNTGALIVLGVTVR